jgi:outer membrane murein-binding lipoprotein Lpp
MRVSRTLTALVLGLAVLGSGTVASAKTKVDHNALAAKYEKMAADQDAIVAEHEQMKKDKKAMQAGIPKQTREKVLGEMEDHCDAIISDAKKLGNDYRDMAKWHKMRAQEEKMEK